MKYISAIFLGLMTLIPVQKSFAQDKSEAMRFEISLNHRGGNNVVRSYLILSGERPATYTQSDHKTYVSWCGKPQEGGGIKTDSINTGTKFELSKKKNASNPLIQLSWDISILDKFESVKIGECVQQTPVTLKDAGKREMNIEIGDTVIVSTVHLGKESYDLIMKRTF